MHPEADAFLDAIFDNPDDDTPRLVYADWLQEHGQENYAQFIRLQCAAAREKLWSDEANRLWEEIGRVWTRLEDEWWPAARDEWYTGEFFHATLLDAVHFERGFPMPSLAAAFDQVHRYATCWPWLAIIDSVLLHPDVTCGHATSDSSLQRLRRAALSEAWLAIRTNSYTINRLIEFLRLPHLCRLTELDLSHALTLTPEVIDVLLTAPNLSSVNELSIPYGDESEIKLIDDAMPALRARFSQVHLFG